MRPGLAVHEFLVLCLTTLLVPALGHGRLWEPPSRASMWRQGYNNPINYQDNELFCGGFAVQYEVNGGKCGVCGDPWNGPREHEAGGSYANGIIVRSYKVGQVIDIVVDLSANHKGYFEFHICPTDNPFEKITEECLAKYPLTEEKTGKVKYPILIPEYSGKIKMRFRLPGGIKCRACMLQWKYNAGNSWGDSPNGTGCVGCGNQEQFYGCADVAVGYDDVVLARVPINQGYAKADEAQSSIFQDTVCRCGFLSVISVIIVVLITFAAL